MKYLPLGTSGLEVSNICLGSMTWGLQNNQQDANEQIAYALAHGINFIDTAEMYAVPPSPDTYGKTEAIIGNWLHTNKAKRGDIVLASKITGVGLPWVRDGKKITGKDVIKAVDDSLTRLQTDYIDLYQIHWPNRISPHFGKHSPNAVTISEADKNQELADILDILQAVQTCVDAGKIHHLGLSNETPWGIHQYLNLAKEHNLPRPVSIQNEFNLLHLKDWPYLIETCIHEQVAYLPWSPLAGGILSGKYLNGARPEGARWSFEQRNGLFRDTEQSQAATAAYAKLAKAHGYTTAQLALAWCEQVDGVTSTIIGATSMQQLKEDIDAFTMPLTNELKAEMAKIIKQYPAAF